MWVGASRAVRELSKIREDKPVEARAASMYSPAGGERGQMADVTVWRFRLLELTRGLCPVFLCVCPECVYIYHFIFVKIWR